MKTLWLASFVVMMASCRPSTRTEMECGIGVRNDGTLDTRAITVRFNGREYSFGGVKPGSFALHGGGLYLEEGKAYPPVEFEFGLMKDYPKEDIIEIEWDGMPIPSGFKPPGEYPALMIVIYPGVEGKKPGIVWRE
ncbi:hypothetical protein ACFQY0_04525 [Haloferula chungangensis]|uniref:Uncharacterized protein n=1 Tax=Haloferula chungangensis TaxID=1048331 RepID=A0ABW2L555_9BACT